MKATSTIVAVCATALACASSAQAQREFKTQFQYSNLYPRFEFLPAVDHVGIKLNELAADRFAVSGQQDGSWGWEGADNFVIAPSPIDPTQAVIAHTPHDPSGNNQGVVACLPYLINGDQSDHFYEILSEVLISEQQDNVAIGWMNNGPDRGGTFAEGRGELWAELFYANQSDRDSKLASYRVLAKGDHHTLASTEETGLKIDMSEGFVELELAWDAQQRTFAARAGEYDLRSGQRSDEVSNGFRHLDGSLAGIVDDGGAPWSPSVEGIGFQLTGNGAFIGSFAAIPEPGTATLAMTTTLLALALAAPRRRAA